MKDFIKKYRDWKYGRSEKFQSALNAANKELERQRNWNEYQSIKNDDAYSVSEKYAAFSEYMDYLKQEDPELYQQMVKDAM
jgi:hypothetical protein